MFNIMKNKISLIKDNFSKFPVITKYETRQRMKKMCRGFKRPQKYKLQILIRQFVIV